LLEMPAGTGGGEMTMSVNREPSAVNRTGAEGGEQGAGCREIRRPRFTVHGSRFPEVPEVPKCQ